MTKTAPEILDAAAGHLRDRASTYDKPEGERSMAQTVAIFNQFHGLNLTETQGWHFLQVLKDVRYFSRAEHHQDSAEDCVAYAALKAEAGAVERMTDDQRREALREAADAKEAEKPWYPDDRPGWVEYDKSFPIGLLMLLTPNTRVETLTDRERAERKYIELVKLARDVNWSQVCAYRVVR